jgi:hypothetical protein
LCHSSSPTPHDTGAPEWLTVALPQGVVVNAGYLIMTKTCQGNTLWSDVVIFHAVDGQGNPVLPQNAALADHYTIISDPDDSLTHNRSCALGGPGNFNQTNQNSPILSATPLATPDYAGLPAVFQALMPADVNFAAAPAANMTKTQPEVLLPNHYWGVNYTPADVGTNQQQNKYSILSDFTPASYVALMLVVLGAGFVVIRRRLPASW